MAEGEMRGFIIKLKGDQVVEIEALFYEFNDDFLHLYKNTEPYGRERFASYSADMVESIALEEG